jgi:hypothetical protein
VTAYEDDRAAKLYGPAPKPRGRPAAKVPGTVPGLVRLSDVRARPVRWLWPGWLPGGNLVMLDGDPGVGKSTVALDWEARVTTGRPWPDGQKCGRGIAMHMTAEEGLGDTVRPRLELAGGDPDRLLVLAGIPVQDGGLRLPSLPLDIPYIEDIVRTHKVRLLTVDVLASFLGGDKGAVNSHQDTDVRRALYPLFTMAERTGVCVVMLRHLNKMASLQNAMYRGGGSIGISGQARAVHLAAYDPDDPSGTRRILAPVKVNQARKPRAMAYMLASDDPAPGAPARVHWFGEDRHTAEDLLAMSVGEDERDDRDHTVAWVQDYLLEQPGHECAYSSIQAAARNAGIPERTLRNARKRAGVSYRRAGWQSGTVWLLDGDVVARLKAERIEAIGAAPGEAAAMASMGGANADGR